MDRYRSIFRGNAGVSGYCRYIRVSNGTIKVSASPTGYIGRRDTFYRCPDLCLEVKND